MAMEMDRRIEQHVAYGICTTMDIQIYIGGTHTIQTTAIGSSTHTRWTMKTNRFFRMQFRKRYERMFECECVMWTDRYEWLGGSHALRAGVCVHCSVFTTLSNNNSDKFETYFSKSILTCHAAMEALDADTGGGRPSNRFDSCIFYFIGHFSPTAYCPINKSYFNISSRRQVTKLPQQMHTVRVCVCVFGSTECFVE